MASIWSLRLDRTAPWRSASAPAVKASTRCPGGRTLMLSQTRLLQVHSPRQTFASPHRPSKSLAGTRTSGTEMTSAGTAREHRDNTGRARPLSSAPYRTGTTFRTLALSDSSLPVGRPSRPGARLAETSPHLSRRGANAGPYVALHKCPIGATSIRGGLRLEGLMLHFKPKVTVFAAALSLLGLVGSQASADIVDYYISGNAAVGSGQFLFKFVGDNSKVSNNTLDYRLFSETVTHPGGDTATYVGTTALHFYGNSITITTADWGCTRACGLPLWGFYLSPSDAAEFDFQAGYGPVVGSGVFAGFFGPAPISGDAQFWSTSDPSGSPAPAPIPGAGVLSLAFFAIVGLRSRAKAFLKAAYGRR